MPKLVQAGGITAAVAPVTNPGQPPVTAVALTDGEGNVLKVNANGDGTGNLVVGGAGVSTFLTYLPGAQAPNNAGVSFSTAQISYLAVDITVTSFQGGTSPTIQFFVDRLGSDNIWYNVWSSQTTGTAATSSFDLGPGFAASGPPNGSQHAVFTGTARFRWVSTGSPTTVTFSASVIGR